MSTPSVVAAPLAPPPARDAALVLAPVRPVIVWLVSLLGLLLLILVVGGTTRLTGSGLSIVHWQPVTGVLPPLSRQDWLDVFAQYQASPQYQQVNAGMSLAQFKAIFFWEYLHRLLARFIGVVTFVPWLVLLWRRRLDRRLALRTGSLLVLGGLQGLVGWLMVKSGLVDVPAVSHFRLATHLGMALLVGGWIVWLLVDLAPEPLVGSAPRHPALKRAAWALVGLATVTAVWGAFMAGTRAGYLYTTFPDLNGEWWPTGALALSPAWHNLFDNPLMIHALHRLLAYLLAASVIGFVYALLRATPTRRQRLLAHGLLALVVAQITLGALTVMSSVALPLAVAHQVVGFVLVLTCLATARGLGAKLPA